MKKVDIYIYTEYKGSLAKGSGKWHVLLEYITKTKTGYEPATVKEFGVEEEITKNRLELIALDAALAHLVIKCNINIHINSEYVENAFKNGWVDKWANNNFKSKNKPIRHADLWEKIVHNACVNELTIFKSEKTQYTAAQKIELKQLSESKR